VVTVTDIVLTPSQRPFKFSRVLWFVQATVNGVLIDRITIRRAADGQHWVAYPRHKDRQGTYHPIATPVPDALRAEVDRLLLAAAGIRQPAQGHSS
jgi:DNA-binding cell septation regulator SpoVG